MFGKKGSGRKPKRTKEDAWRDVAGRAGGQLVMDRKGKKLKEVRFEVGGWTVVLDTTVESTGQTAQTYTRLRALYMEKLEFRFRAYTKSAFSGLGKAMGMQDIVVGHPKVDDAWIIKADSEGRIRSMMIMPEVADGLAAAKNGRIETRRYKRSMPDIRELRFQMLGVATDDAALEAWVRMMFAVLAYLKRSGVARPEPPEVTP